MWLSLLGIAVSILVALAAIFFQIWREKRARVINWNALPPQVIVHGTDADELQIQIGDAKIRSLTKYTFVLENCGRQDIEWAQAAHFDWSGPGRIVRAKAADDETNEAWKLNLCYEAESSSVSSENAVPPSDLAVNKLSITWGALRAGSTHQVEVYCESGPQHAGTLDAVVPNTRVRERSDFMPVGKDTRTRVRSRVWVALVAGFLVSLQVPSLLIDFEVPSLVGAERSDALVAMMAILVGYVYTAILMAGIYRVYPVERKRSSLTVLDLR